MTTRTVTWFESRYDLAFITKNQWNFQISKSVLTGTGSQPVSNVIWQSLGPAPQYAISWDVVYGLNWTANIPTDGATVVAGGVWQQCDKGASYDLNKLGFWDPSTTPGKAGWMSVGTVNYKYPTVDGIHIIVGVKVAGSWQTIFVDPTALPPGSSGAYQPQEQCKWWLFNSNLTGTVYSKTHGSVGGVDLSSPAPETNQYAWWTTYISSSGQWVNSQKPPASAFTAPPPSEAFELAPKQVNNFEKPSVQSVEFTLWPLVRNVVFGAAVGAGLQAGVAQYIKNDMLKNFTYVEVNWQSPNTGKVLNVKWGSPKTAKEGSLEMLGIAVGDSNDNAALQQALNDALAAKSLPSGETWQIENA